MTGSRCCSLACSSSSWSMGSALDVGLASIQSWVRPPNSMNKSVQKHYNAIIKPLTLQQVFQVLPIQSLNLINHSLSRFSIDVSKPNRGKSSSSRSLAHSLGNIPGHLNLQISSVISLGTHWGTSWVI